MPDDDKLVGSRIQQSPENPNKTEPIIPSTAGTVEYCQAWLEAHSTESGVCRAGWVGDAEELKACALHGRLSEKGKAVEGPENKWPNHATPQVFVYAIGAG